MRQCGGSHVGVWNNWQIFCLKSPKAVRIGEDYDENQVCAATLQSSSLSLLAAGEQESAAATA